MVLLRSRDIPNSISKPGHLKTGSNSSHEPVTPTRTSEPKPTPLSPSPPSTVRRSSRLASKPDTECSVGDPTRKGKTVTRNLKIKEVRGNGEFSSGFLSLRSGKRVVKRKVVSDSDGVGGDGKESDFSVVVNEIDSEELGLDVELIGIAESRIVDRNGESGVDGCNEIDSEKLALDVELIGEAENRVVNGNGEYGADGCCVDESIALRAKRSRRYCKEERVESNLVAETLEVIENCIKDKEGEYGGNVVGELKEHPCDVDVKRMYGIEVKGKGKAVDKSTLVENCVEDKIGECGGNVRHEEDGDDVVKMKEHHASGNDKKRTKYSKEEKGKAKVIDESLVAAEDTVEDKRDNEDGDVVDKPKEHACNDKKRNRYSREDKGKGKLVDEEADVVDANLSKMNDLIDTTVKNVNAESEPGKADAKVSGSRMGQFRDIARKNASRFALFGAQEEEDDEEMEEEQKTEEDWPGPFSTAMKIIRDREYKINSPQAASGSYRAKSVPIKWIPRANTGFRKSKVKVPSLQELSMKNLAKHADAVTSLEYVPDSMRHRLCQLLCDTRRMNSHFLDLLVRDSPVEMRIVDCSWLTEEEFSKRFLVCDTKNLTVLQIDQCGHCLPDYTVVSTLARSPRSLPALTTLSLRGAYRLSDIGLSSLVSSAPALQSVNLNQCSLLTAAGIDTLSNSLGTILQELYIDDCQGIDAMLILPALKKIEHLEVLSIAGIQNVSNKFLKDFIVARGHNMRELILTDCVKLTDSSLKVVAERCSKLRKLDLSNLRKLKDSSLGYLANGCRGLESLKLCRNEFSDEAVAAYLEISGGTLKELSLNNVKEVAHNTALSIAKHARRLQCLDLSWCRNLSDEAFGLIMDSCLSLRLLKVFGCTQITDVFLHGHSNSDVEIIGVKFTPVMERLRPPSLQELPFHYA